MLEKRSYKRLSVSGDTVISEYTIPLPDEEFISELVNISREGALLKTSHYYEPGTLLKLKMMLCGWDKFLPMTYRLDRADFAEPLVSIAEVIRIETSDDSNYMLAVRFEAIDELHQRSLGEFISSNSIK
ncbi:MAG: PilZ domain-containing protein [Oligoflexia bacterium]|nr:PilZ domain-containing protein [Oligoflexia bacterium]